MVLVYMNYSGYGYDMFMGSASLLELLARGRLLTRTTIYSESRQIYEVIRSRVREEVRSWLLFLSWLGQAHAVTTSSLVRSPGEVGLSGQGGRAWQDVDWPRLRVYNSEYSLHKGEHQGKNTEDTWRRHWRCCSLLCCVLEHCAVRVLLFDRIVVATHYYGYVTFD